jgi:phosphatidylglycerol:prolipoprotein diacylglycerol transferase
MIEKIKNNKQGIMLYGLPVLIFLLLVSVAVLVQDGTPYNNIALDLGFAKIAWYAVFILTGISLGAYFAYHEFKRVGWDTELLFDALLYAVPLSIVGSRLYYVLFDPIDRYDSILDVIDITSGGLSIHGAVITAFIFVVLYTRKKKMNFWLLADILAIGFFVGQIIGRWGNFMNQEAYGPVIESEFIKTILPNFILNQMEVTPGNFHHPTFLYEGLWNLVGLIFLLVARRKRWFKVGDMMGLYLIWYGLGRGAIIEPLRTGGHPTDALRMFGLPANIILSLTLFMLGGLAVILIKRKLIPDQPYYVDMLVEES